MKKIIVSSIVILISLCFITGCGRKKEDTKPENTIPQGDININTNIDVVGDKEVENFKFENVSLIYDNGVSRLEAKVTNMSDEVATLSQFRIHIMKDDAEIANLSGYVGNSIKPGETKYFNISYGEDLTSATSINYEIVR